MQNATVLSVLGNDLSKLTPQNIFRRHQAQIEQIFDGLKCKMPTYCEIFEMISVS